MAVTADASEQRRAAWTSFADTFRGRRSLVFWPWIGLGLFVMPLGYALYTGEVWEDFFITFRYSRNLALGNGLVFQPGERVYRLSPPPINTLAALPFSTC